MSKKNKHKSAAQAPRPFALEMNPMASAQAAIAMTGGLPPGLVAPVAPAAPAVVAAPAPVANKVEAPAAPVYESQPAVAVATPAGTDTLLAIDAIDVVPQIRKKFVEIESLADSLKQNGFIAPLVVHAVSDGRYRLICGERRLRAARHAGIGQVPVVIKRGLDERQIRAIQVAENNDSQDLTPYETIQGVIEDVERHGRQVAMQIWNRSEGWVSKRMAVQRFRPEIVDLLAQEICGDLETLYTLHQIAEQPAGAESFTRMMDKLSGGATLTRDEARVALEAVKRLPQDAAVTAKGAVAAPAVDEAEAAQWQEFLAAVMPKLEPLGALRAKLFVKRLQAELKAKSAR